MRHRNHTRRLRTARACAVKPDMLNSVISIVIWKWMLPELSFSDRWSRGTKLWERDWVQNGISKSSWSWAAHPHPKIYRLPPTTPRNRFWLCSGVPVHRGNNHCIPFFKNLCLAVEHYWVFCIGSCELVHKDRTQILYVQKEQMVFHYLEYVMSLFIQFIILFWIASLSC